LLHKGFPTDDEASKLRGTIQRAFDFFTQCMFWLHIERSPYFGLDYPQSPHIVTIEKHWAGLEARQFRNVENARYLYNELVKKCSDDYQVKFKLQREFNL
jgi:hypothetical protein